MTAETFIQFSCQREIMVLRDLGLQGYPQGHLRIGGVRPSSSGTRVICGTRHADISRLSQVKQPERIPMNSNEPAWRSISAAEPLPVRDSRTFEAARPGGLSRLSPNVSQRPPPCTRWCRVPRVESS